MRERAVRTVNVCIVYRLYAVVHRSVICSTTLVISISRLVCYKLFTVCMLFVVVLFGQTDLGSGFIIIITTSSVSLVGAVDACCFTVLVYKYSRESE